MKSDALEKVPTASFEKALQGLSTGVQVESPIRSTWFSKPGTYPRCLIYVVSSSQPLYVMVMAFLFHQRIYQKVADKDSYGTSVNPLSNLNPNDIESISEVLEKMRLPLHYMVRVLLTGLS